MHNKKIKRNNTKVSNMQPTRNLGDIIKIVDKKAKTVEKTYEVGIKNNRTGQIVKVRYPTDAMQKKIGQIVKVRYPTDAMQKKIGQIVKVRYSADTVQKKIAQIGCAYAKIYNRELEDINMIEKGLYRFKK